MTSSSYMLDREIIGSSRAMIDVYSNAPLTQNSTYRSSYGLVNHHHHGHTNGFDDNLETKKVVVDVSNSLI